MIEVLYNSTLSLQIAYIEKCIWKKKRATSCKELTELWKRRKYDWIMIAVDKKTHLSRNVLYALNLWKPTYLFLLDTIPHTALD